MPPGRILLRNEVATRAGSMVSAAWTGRDTQHTQSPWTKLSAAMAGRGDLVHRLK